MWRWLSHYSKEIKMNNGCKVISVYVSEIEYNKLKKEAKANKLPLSLYIRLMLFMKGE